MKRLYLFFITILSLVVFVYISNRSGKAHSNSLENHNLPASSINASAKPASKQSKPLQKPIDRATPIQTSQSKLPWPQDVITSLKQAYPDKTDAIDHIVRATTFENFAALSIEKSERLIRYADQVIELPPHLILYLCWSHQTPDVERSAFESVRALALNEAVSAQPIFRGIYRWEQTTTDGATGDSGTPITIRWSFVPDGTPVPSDVNNLNNYSDSNLIAAFNNVYGPPSTNGDLTTAPWFELFEEAFAYWAEVTGNIYIYEPNDDGASFPYDSGGIIDVRGDVRIGGTAIDGDSGILAFNYFPDLGDMVIDTSDSFVLDPDQSSFDVTKNIIAHEHGHGLGLDHVCPIDETKLMEPLIIDSFYGPQFDDILTVQELYGDQLERDSDKNNDSASTAFNFGTLDSGIVAKGLSVANSTDKDLFKFRINNSRTMNVSVSPTSTDSYLEGVQSENDSCSSGTLYNPQTRQNLAIRILGADGITVLDTADNEGIGSPESIDQFILKDLNQDYYVEVTGGGENSGSLNNAQAYDLEIELINPSALQISDPLIISESCSPANNVIDPGEVITISTEVTNVGTEAALNASITLEGDESLVIIGDAVQSIGTLAAGDSTMHTFSFIVNGNCEEDRTLTFITDSNNGSLEQPKTYRLGIHLAASNDFEATSGTSLPDGFTQTNDNVNAQWQTVTIDEFSPNNRAVYSAGFDGVNSAILIHPTVTELAPDSQLEFDHRYVTESSYDGGVLELSINNGSWTEWLDAGGTFLQNGYNNQIASDYSSPIAGQLAWSGNSEGYLTTIAVFPDSATGQSVRIRWYHANDSSIRVNGGWWIDNVIIANSVCCESPIPTVNVAEADDEASEWDVNDTAEFVITANNPLANELAVAYTLSGDAIAGSDFIALAGTASIAQGSDLVTIPVTAITDAVSEGDETLTLTASTSSDYAIGNASASITIKDLPFDEYRHTFFGEDTLNVAPDEDYDFDGIQNLIEYALRLDPTNPETVPFSLIVQNDSEQTLELHYYEDTQIEDIDYIVETSPTLTPESWTTEGVTITSGTVTNGLINKTASIPVNNEPGFIRVRVERKTQ